MHPARLPLDKFLEQVRFEQSGGSGPGGQHRNRTATFVRAIHEPTGLRSHAGERRSLKLNREIAVERLRRALALRHRREVGNPEDPALIQPSELWLSRCRGKRLVISPRHHDFAALLAEALDVLEALGGDVTRGARLLGVSTSQLVRFLAIDPEALRHVNEVRRSRGLRALKP